MPRFAVEGRAPQVHPEGWVAPSAARVGDVTVEVGASVRYGAVLRADVGAIVVREGALVAAGSTVTPGTVIPAETVVTGTPATVRGPLEGMATFRVDAAVYRDRPSAAPRASSRSDSPAPR